MYVCIIHTYIHTLHYITLRYVTLRYVTLHSYTHTYIHTYIHTYLHTYILTLHYITLHCTTLHYITLHYITLRYITLHYITLHTYIHTLHAYNYIYMTTKKTYMYTQYWSLKAENLSYVVNWDHHPIGRVCHQGLSTVSPDPPKPGAPTGIPSSFSWSPWAKNSSRQTKAQASEGHREMRRFRHGKVGNETTGFGGVDRYFQVPNLLSYRHQLKSLILSICTGVCFS